MKRIYRGGGGEETLGWRKRGWTRFMCPGLHKVFFFLALLPGCAKTRMGDAGLLAEREKKKIRTHPAPPFGSEQGLSGFIGLH